MDSTTEATHEVAEVVTLGGTLVVAELKMATGMLDRCRMVSATREDQTKVTAEVEDEEVVISKATRQTITTGQTTTKVTTTLNKLVDLTSSRTVEE